MYILLTVSSLANRRFRPLSHRTKLLKNKALLQKEPHFFIDKTAITGN
jgi:hypothetical protein